MACSGAFGASWVRAVTWVGSLFSPRKIPDFLFLKIWAYPEVCSAFFMCFVV